MKHKFILEPDEEGYGATLWYDHGGRQYPVKRFSGAELISDDVKEFLLKYGIEYTKRMT